MNDVLLLTSTIKPRKDQPALRLVDPALRLADYSAALEQHVTWLARGVVSRIVYADNSGFDLTPLKERFPSPAIEWISFYDLDYDPSFHRGYGEFRLIDRAYALSTTLAGTAGSDVVWKLTGRYAVRNLGAFSRLTPRPFDLCCDVKGKWAEMGFMGWSRAGYDRFVHDLWQHFASPMAPELIVAARLADEDLRGLRIIKSFYWPPVLAGRRGVDGSPLQGRFTPLRLALAGLGKLVALPVRHLGHRLHAHDL